MKIIGVLLPIALGLGAWAVLASLEPHSIPKTPATRSTPSSEVVSGEAARGPPVGETVAPPQRDVTPADFTRLPPVSGPLVRVPGIVPPPIAQPVRSAVTLHRVLVPQPGMLRSKDSTIHLARIAPLPLDATCVDSRGDSWPCGMAARTALRRLIRGRAVTCRRADGEAIGTTSVADCAIGKLDIADWLMKYGWALPAESAESELLAEAKAAGRGRWREIGLPKAAPGANARETVSHADEPPAN